MRLLSAPLLFAACSALSACGSENSAASDESGFTERARPPQFVLLAFDGSKDLAFWEESRAFARDNHLKFTYFASGVYFLQDSKKTVYHAPHYGAGASGIGFGGPGSSIPLRVHQMNLAYQEGNEIASHANGHYDGHTWSAADWDSEFAQFNKLIFETAANNGIETEPLLFTKEEVVGFRAPLLAKSPGLYTTLTARGFHYDTSKTSAPNYWPQKSANVWNFPLASLDVAGSCRTVGGAKRCGRTLSMDYNFYYYDSAGKERPENKAKYKQRMLDSYMAYFEGNYFGNRAPVHIGHHFSRWNGGAYWEAMQTFAQRVCGLPEVQCVTYRDLERFVTESEDALADYQGGHFPPMPRPPGAEPEDDLYGLDADPTAKTEDVIVPEGGCAEADE